MTKKDYMKLAQALKDSKPTDMQLQADNSNIALHEWHIVINHVSLVLEHDNPRFDRDRFLAACGYSE